MRLKSLQMARTMSNVGLPIGAEALGLPEATNAAVVQACEDQSQQLDRLRLQFQELRDQAVLRFVAATQLAAAPVVASTVGLHAGEIQAAQLAVTCLAKLKSIWSVVKELQRQHRQLYCLTLNTAGNQHLADLTTSLCLTTGEVAESTRKTLQQISDLGPAAQAFGIRDLDRTEPRRC